MILNGVMALILRYFTEFGSNICVRTAGTVQMAPKGPEYASTMSSGKLFQSWAAATGKARL